MASAFTHAFAGIALGKAMSAGPMPVRYWVLAAACGILPDADAIGFYLGVPYGSTFGHRGFSHSILFAAIVGVVVTILFFNEAAVLSREWWGTVAIFFLVTLSHPLLDAVTNGGLGVALFSPFDTARYFLPWRPVQVSPIGIASFFTARGVAVLASEFVWIWIPCIVLVGAVEMYRRITTS